MASKYWIKLYHEILDDPKMGRLPDNLWRRTTELFLFAGELDDGGFLPPVDDMAWRLRLDEETLAGELEELAKIDIVQLVDERWFVTQFAKRQAKVSDAERMQRYRDRQRKAQYYGDDNEPEPVTSDVTERNADIEEDIEEEKEDSAEKPSANPPEQPPPEPKPQKSESKPRKPKVPVPEAVKVFRASAHRYPAKSWYSKVAAAVGDSEKSLALWGSIVEAWVGLGWKPTNVKGMLECYERGEIPGNGRLTPTGAPVKRGMSNVANNAAVAWRVIERERRTDGEP